MSARSRTLSTVVSLGVVAALVVPAMVAFARHGGTAVSGKRLAAKDGRVVTVSARRGRVKKLNGELRVAAPTRRRPRPTPVETPEESTTPAPVGAPSGPCNGTKVAAGANLQSAINAAAEGATLCLSAGTYNTSSTIKLKDGMKLIGAGRDATFITTTSADTVLEARNTTGVVFQSFDVSGGIQRGIRSGLNTIVNDVRVHHNGTAGIGGTDGNLLIVNSELAFNGQESQLGISASGVKTGKAFTIRDSYVHDNTGVGIWCDVGCDGGTYTVQNNVVENNFRGGIRYEISGSAALISGNVVRNNNLENKGGHGGIEIASSRNAVVENNTLAGNKGVGIGVGGNRSPGTGDVTVRNNALNGDTLRGCGGTVTCTNNK